jgi:SAM-dependent methyltransferase
MTAEPTVNDATFWQNLYAQGGDRWELGRPSPSLDAHLARAPFPPGVVAVPGCGRGHDARLLARHGHRVLGFDFVPETLRVARGLAELEGTQVTFENRDVFDLAAVYPGCFDGVLEYTCYCAIDPRRRPEYVAVLAAILRPGGWLLACFFPMGDKVGGPPFAVNETEVRVLLAPHFELVEDYVPTVSPENRQGREWVVLARLRSAAPA